MCPGGAERKPVGPLMSGTFLKPGDDPAARSGLVAMTRKDVEDVERLLRLLAKATDARYPQPSTTAHPWQAVTRESLIVAARQLLRDRERRTQFLPPGMLGEPAWELLLQLYAEQNGARMNIARLTSAVRLPPSTALRWLGYLEGKQLVCKEAHPTDQRSSFIELTAQAIEALDLYFSERIRRTA